MSSTPTDAELDALRQADNGALNFVTLRQFRTVARAVLAKWGQPAPRGEPVAWLSPWRADQVTTDYDAYGEHGIPLVRQQPVERGWCDGCSPENCPGCMLVPAKKQP